MYTSRGGGIVHPRSVRQLLRLAVALVLALAVLACTAAPGGRSAQTTETPSQGPSAGGEATGTTGTPVTPRTAAPLPPTDEQYEFRAASAALTRVVFNVEIEQEFNTGAGKQFIPIGNGSGISIRQDGYILTNDHVVKGADKLDVDYGGKHIPAKVIGRDPSTDLAVIKIDRTGMPVASIGDPSKLALGEWVLAVGSPFGLEHSVSAGIVSSIGRSLFSPEPTQTAAAYTNLIQTDASINPGNSGGALGTLQGQVVGVNAVVESPSGVSSGVGFAIPIDFAMNIAEQLIRTGHAVHPYLGANVAGIDSHIAFEMGLQTSVERGAVVEEVLPGSPAEKAGLRSGDIVTSLGGKQVIDAGTYWAALRALSIGSTANLVIDRDGKAATLRVRVGSGRAG
jgi:putative serine protease PepD